MPSVPSHGWFCFQNVVGRSCILINPCRHSRPFRSSRTLSQADPAILPIGRFTVTTARYPDTAQFICSRGVSVQPIHARAQPGGIYDFL